MDATIRPITADEVEIFCRRMRQGFGDDLQPEDDLDRFRETVELARTVCAFDGAELVGTCAAVTFDVSVPGGALPMGGTTMVTVQPTHRRRGLMKRMMRAHLEEVRGRGEPLAGLWASEASIYGRFGFGLAAEGCDLKLDARLIRFRGEPPSRTVRLVDAERAAAVMPGVHEAMRGDRPGMLTRTPAWWRWLPLYDAAHRRRGESAKRFAVCEGPDGVDGYVIYRQKEQWDDFPEGVVTVQELMAASPAAHETLWRYLTSIDLFPMVRYWNLPVDDALPWRLTEPRRAVRTVTDSLWLRLMDIPRALAGRRYASDDHLVLGIRDPFLPENDGRYTLEVHEGEGVCRRTDAVADVEMSVDTLAALYMGGHRLGALARAGLVRGDADVLLRADRLFAWPRAPWCPEDF